MQHPPAPWRLQGSLWIGTFWLPSRAIAATRQAGRPAGLYGCAVVDYREPGILTYRELLVARLQRPAPLRVRITDIWVDSPVSMVGGRRLWAIPKDLAAFDLAGAADSLEASVALPQDARAPGPVLAVAGRRRGPAGPRLPFRFATDQRREHVPTAGAGADPDATGRVLTAVAGTARVGAASTDWRFEENGALGWLRGARHVGSLVLEEFDLTFG